MKINLVYLTNLNYRKSLFGEISKLCDFNLIAGNRSPYNNIVLNKDNSSHNFYLVKNIFFLKGHHRLTLQLLNKKVFNLVRKSKESEFVFLGIDIHIISSLFYSLILISLGYKVSWWGHGKLGKGIIRKIRVFIYEKSHRILVYGNNSEVSEVSYLKSKVKVLGNSMNWDNYSTELLERERTFKISKILGDEIKILFSGRIVESKKLEVLLEACNSLRIKYSLKIIGKGERLNDYKRFCIEKKMNVTFLGAIYGEGVKEFMDWADIMVIPGKVGLSLIHAYANRLPTIIHNSFEDHSPEYEVHTMNENFIFEKNSSSDLSNKIELIHKNNFVTKEITDSSESLYNYGYFPDVVANKFVNSLIHKNEANN